MNIYILLTLK